MSFRFDCADASARSRGIDRAGKSVGDGELVVLPTDTAYGVGCDAFSPVAVSSLLSAKGRGRGQPPPVMVPHARTLDGIATRISPAVRDLAEAFWPGPLTIVCHAQPTLEWDLGDTRGSVSVRMPLHPVALELLAKTGPLAVTGANVAGQPLPTTYEQAHAQLGEAAAVYLDAGPASRHGVSTIVDGRLEEPRVVRLGALTLAELRAVVPAIVGPDDD